MSHPENFKPTYNKLLTHETPPLQVLPSLALAIGLNEAIILQQIHYLISNPLNNNFFNGKRWVCSTYEDWNRQFPFWSKETVIRTLRSLESKNLIISGIFNKFPWDRTKSYTIDYNEINNLNIGYKITNLN